MTTEIVKYEANKPVQSTGTLKQLFEQMGPSIKSQLPQHIRPETLLRAALLAVQKDSKLLKCTQESFFGAMMDSARLGLSVGGGGPASEAHLVPFGKEVVLIPDYRGLVKLARQSGDVGRIEAEAVFEHDTFMYRRGIDPVCEFSPAKGNRGKLECFYMLVMDKENKTVLAQDYMTKADVEKVRKASKSKDSPAWKQWFEAMGKKTVLRRGLKLAPSSAENKPLLEAIKLSDREFEFGPTEVDVTESTKTEQLAATLGDDEPKAAAAPNKLTAAEIKEVKELCEAEPSVPVSELEQLWGDSLEKIEFPVGQVPIEQARLELVRLKKKAARGQRELP